MRETVVRCFSKKDVAVIKEDKRISDYIANSMKNALAERLIKVVEENGDIIIKKPAYRIAELPFANHIEYRKSFDWERLVFCKNCIYFEPDEDEYCEWGLCRNTGCGVRKDGFCSEAARRVKEDENN